MTLESSCKKIEIRKSGINWNKSWHMIVNSGAISDPRLVKLSIQMKAKVECWVVLNSAT